MDIQGGVTSAYSPQHGVVLPSMSPVWETPCSHMISLNLHASRSVYSVSEKKEEKKRKRGRCAI